MTSGRPRFFSPSPRHRREGRARSSRCSELYSTGVGDVEAVFTLLIVARRAFGARFGLRLGAATIAVSSVLWGGIGNLSSFLLYSLVTSTAGWDTLRAVTTIIGIVVVGRAVLAAFRRVKPVTGPGGSLRRDERMEVTDSVRGPAA